MKRFLYYHLPAVLYAVLIIVLSSIPDLNPKEVPFLHYDKLIHFVEYALFAVLVFRSFSNISGRLTIRIVFLLSLLFIGIFALLDEFYQSFIPGREPDLYDIIFDFSGAVLLVYILYSKVKRRE